MPDAIPILVKTSLLLLVLSSGLQARWQDLTYVIRRPGLLLRAFIAVNVVVPSAALILCLLLPIAPLTRAGLVIMAVSPLAPFAPSRMHQSGADKGVVYGLYVALLLAAVVIVPATIDLLDRFSRFAVDVPVRDMAVYVATSVLLPLAAGLAIGTVRPQFAKHLAPIAFKVSFVIILAVLLLIVATTWSRLITLVGDGTLAAIVLTTLSGIVAGHWLGGPRPQQRIAIAQAAITRHPGIASLIAHRNFDNPQVMLAIILFLLFSMIVGIAYGMWVRSRR